VNGSAGWCRRHCRAVASVLLPVRRRSWGPLPAGPKQSGTPASEPAAGTSAAAPAGRSGALRMGLVGGARAAWRAGEVLSVSCWRAATSA
jgi:hypothetical protein